MKWYEGTVENAFEDSFFLFNPVQGTPGVSAGDKVQVSVRCILFQLIQGICIRV